MSGKGLNSHNYVKQEERGTQEDEKAKRYSIFSIDFGRSEKNSTYFIQFQDIPQDDFDPEELSRRASYSFYP